MINDEARMMGHGEAKRALDRLWAIFKRRGKGTIRWVEDELGLSSGALHTWRQRSYLRYSDLITILLLLDEDPGGFFSGLFPPGSVDQGPPTTSHGDLALLLREADSLMYEDPLAALRLLSSHEQRFSCCWDFCLAVGIALRLLELWSKAEKWIQMAGSLAPDEQMRCKCVVRATPILIGPRGSPEEAIEILRKCAFVLSGSERALALQHLAIALKNAGNYPAAARTCGSVISSQWASERAVCGSWQTLGLTLATHARDLSAGQRCLDNATRFARDRMTRGRLFWVRARFAPDTKSSSNWYNLAFRELGDGLLFESLQVAIERFYKLGFDSELYCRLKRRCRSRDGLFLEVVQELEAASQLEDKKRAFADVKPLLKSNWDKWRLSQLQRLKF